MKGPELLAHYEDNWETDMGAWFPGERVVLRGKDLFSEFGESSWMEYLLFIVTGKRNPELANLIQTIWVLSTSYPDPRLWNNRVASFAASSRSTGVLALSSGVAVSEATIYGLKPIKGATDFFIRVKKKLQQGDFLEEIITDELVKYKSVYGYGRPMVAQDERVVPVLMLAKRLGFDKGEYLDLAFDVEKILSEKHRMKINIAAVYAALMADAGLSAIEAYYMASLSFTAGMLGPFVDALDKPEAAFFPLSVNRLRCSGFTETRKWGDMK
ncbi:MAG: hypothetical protein R3E73_11870 [Porticoccaceae bacterium]|nr:hypothetical protein [Pseudomonadales bacterium]MCP5171976.1 hypothetical protein [Pseudomonadales bacterium]